MVAILVLVLGLLTVISLWTLHKVRRAHLMMYRIQSDIETTRREVTVLFSQLQALQALERLLNLPHSLPALRGWAGSPDMLLEVAQRVRRMRPSVVLECSSGASTIVAARCCQLNGTGHVYSLEHDESYAQKTRDQLALQGLDGWATVVHAPLELGADGSTWYRDSALPAAATQAELLIVDGPPAGGDSQARYPALPRLRTRLASHFTVMLDDADRPGEREVVAKWLKLEPQLRSLWVPCEKGLAVISKES